MTKKELRKLIAEQKQRYSIRQTTEWSSSLFQKLEDHPLFVQADTILLYHSLPDEVNTRSFIERWYPQKRIVLPMVKGNELEFRYYEGKESLQAGAFGIEEPRGKVVQDLNEITLSIIPGVAFDRNGNRLGRGKGYYDRALSRLNSHNIGVCFHFQLLPHIPTETTDHPMHEVWTEQGCVFNGIQYSQSPGNPPAHSGYE